MTIVYIDADAYFRPKTTGKQLKSLIKSHDKPLIMGKDLSQLINTGFMIIKNCNFSKNIFWKLLIGTEFKQFYNKRTWEQDAFIKLYNNNFVSKSKTKLLDYGILQSYKKQDHMSSLIIHYEQSTHEERLDWLKKDHDEIIKEEEPIFESLCFI